MKTKLTLLLATLGFLVSLYLLIPYLSDQSVAFCPTGSDGVSGCDVVKDSEFSSLLGVPLPAWGMLFYGFMFLYPALRYASPELTERLEKALRFQPDFLATVFGFLFSLYLTGLEAFVIHAWCLYCVIQAIVAVLLFVIYLLFSPAFLSWAYRHLVKPFLFRLDPEFVHDRFAASGRIMGRLGLVRRWLEEALVIEDERLEVTLGPNTYKSPVGLAAGFDYNGLITPVSGAIGFGFESVGTVSNRPSEGNQKPRLGRLPKSGALLVNKGFRNLGIDQVVNDKLVFTDDLRLGLSIGATNAPDTADAQSQIADILAAFARVKDDDRFAYFELNISCPNVAGSGALDNPEALTEILGKLHDMQLVNPLWIKFPTEITWERAKPLLQIMVDHGVEAVVIGNLAKQRDNPALDPGELTKVGKGNFSGKPVWELSNRLIEQTYAEFGDKLPIIGLGGIFTAEDAYHKIRLGASMVQLITGMIFGGPAAINRINQGLLELLERDGYTHISEAVGTLHKS